MIPSRERGYIAAARRAATAAKKRGDTAPGGGIWLETVFSRVKSGSRQRVGRALVMAHRAGLVRLARFGSTRSGKRTDVKLYQAKLRSELTDTSPGGTTYHILKSW